MEKTPLDEALESAFQDRRQGSFFYDLFLNAELFLPVQFTESAQGAWKELKPTDKFFPLFLKFPEGKAIPCFDLLQRMKDWAGTKELDFIRIKGFQLIQTIDPAISLLLNPGTTFNYVLTPEVLEKLRNAMRPVTAS